MMPESTDHDILIRLDEKVDTMLVWQKTHVGDHRVQEKRVTQLEQWRWRWGGIAVVLIFLLTLAGNLAMRLVAP